MSRRLCLVLTALLLLALVVPASAARRDGLAFTVGCTGFTSLGGSVILNRDNTGSGREQFQILAKDGFGTVIYSGPLESFFAGSTIYFPINHVTSFSGEPAANPIVVSVISGAGNGLNEQVVYSASGRCAGLPEAKQAETIVSATTSPSVPVNTLPPSGENSDDTIAALPGYVIVNTSFLNLRSGDGPEYTIVGRVAGGDKLIVLGRNEDFSWWLVQAGDVTGWVITDFVIARGDLRGTPIVIPAGEIALPRFFLYSSTVLRATVGGEALCTVPGNLEYEIVGRTSSLSDVKVNATCDDAAVQGWLPVSQGAVRNVGGVSIPVVP